MARRSSVFGEYTSPSCAVTSHCRNLELNGASTLDGILDVHCIGITSVSESCGRNELSCISQYIHHKSRNSTNATETSCVAPHSTECAGQDMCLCHKILHLEHTSSGGLWNGIDLRMILAIRLSGQPIPKTVFFCVVFVASADLELDEPPVRERNPRA